MSSEYRKGDEEVMMFSGEPDSPSGRALIEFDDDTEADAQVFGFTKSQPFLATPGVTKVLAVKRQGEWVIVGIK